MDLQVTAQNSTLEVQLQLRPTQFFTFDGSAFGSAYMQEISTGVAVFLMFVLISVDFQESFPKPTVYINRAVFDDIYSSNKKFVEIILGGGSESIFAQLSNGSIRFEQPNIPFTLSLVKNSLKCG